MYYTATTVPKIWRIFFNLKEDKFTLPNQATVKLKQNEC